MAEMRLVHDAAGHAGVVVFSPLAGESEIDGLHGGVVDGEEGKAGGDFKGGGGGEAAADGDVGNTTMASMPLVIMQARRRWLRRALWGRGTSRGASLGTDLSWRIQRFPWRRWSGCGLGDRSGGRRG